MMAAAVARGARHLLVLAAAQAARLPHDDSRRMLGVTHVHFHKAGGSSMDGYLAAAGWERVGDRLRKNLAVRAALGVPSSVDDGWDITDYLNWTDGITPAIEVLQLAQGSGEIVFERSFPPPHITAALTCVTAVVTSLRRPFERWASQYERELFIRCRYMRRTKFTRCALAYNVSVYATAPNERDPYGATAAPNYYVRSMLGRTLEAAVGGVTTAQLEQAQGLLTRFDAVVYVEQPDDVKLAILAARLPPSPHAGAGLPASYPHSSNNGLHHGHGPLVSAYQALRMSRPDAPDPRVPAHRARFDAENGPDEAFYAFGTALSDAMAAELTRPSRRGPAARLLAVQDSEPDGEQPKTVPTTHSLGAPTSGGAPAHQINSRSSGRQDTGNKECRHTWRLWQPGEDAAGASAD